MFIRKYQIIFGATYKIIDENAATGTSVYGVYKVNGEFVKITDIDDYLSSNGKTFYSIEGDITEGKTGLQIEFDILKNATTSRNNSSSLTVYNLSDEIISYLKQNSSNNVAISIKAGYADDGMKLIFKGTVGNVTDTWEGEIRKTVLTLHDGNLNVKEAFSSVSYKKGTKVDTIVSDLLSSFGLPKNTGLIATLGSDETIEKPYYYSGLSIHGIDEWAKKYKMNFSIQDSMVCYMPIDGRTDNIIAVISEDTGLVGNIVPKSTDNTTLSLDKISKGTVYKLKVLLNGAITPESTIKLDTDEYKDIFLKVITVEHKGSYESGSWVTELEAKLVDNIVTVGSAYTRATS